MTGFKIGRSIPSKRTRRLTPGQKKDGWRISKCPTCKGTGQYHQRECGLCKGKKEVLTHI